MRILCTYGFPEISLSNLISRVNEENSKQALFTMPVYVFTITVWLKGLIKGSHKLCMKLGLDLGNT
jgi:hypothetical protein